MGATSKVVPRTVMHDSPADSGGDGGSGVAPGSHRPDRELPFARQRDLKKRSQVGC